MFEPFYNTPDRYKEYNQLKKQAQGLCINCNKPLNYNHAYCGDCKYKLVKTGLEAKRVQFKDIGLDTINYQQSLHTAFFNCNAPYQYRGKAEERIRVTVPEALITKQTKALRNLFSKIDQPQLASLIADTSEVRNLYRRILYNLVLVSISYHIHHSNLFRSEAHYQATLTNLPINHMHKTRYRISKKKEKVDNFSTTFYYNLYKKLVKIVEPILVEIV